MFDVDGIFENFGAITALGGGGGFNGYTSNIGYGGAGAGGYIFIDPIAILNHGLIDVSDGSGNNLFGGSVDLVAQTIVNDGMIVGDAPDAPEPASAALFLTALASLNALRRRKSGTLPR